MQENLPLLSAADTDGEPPTHLHKSNQLPGYQVCTLQFAFRWECKFSCTPAQTAVAALLQMLMRVLKRTSPKSGRSVPFSALCYFQKTNSLQKKKLVPPSCFCCKLEGKRYSRGNKVSRHKCPQVAAKKQRKICNTRQNTGTLTLSLCQRFPEYSNHYLTNKQAKRLIWY